MRPEAIRRAMWRQTAEGEQMVPVNVFETANDLVVTVPMPGLEPENIDVTITGEMLTIRGELRGPGQQRRDYRLHEWSYGPYWRQIELPYPVDAERADASYGNGVLALTLPKRVSAKTRRIELSQTGR